MYELIHNLISYKGFVTKLAPHLLLYSCFSDVFKLTAWLQDFGSPLRELKERLKLPLRAAPRTLVLRTNGAASPVPLISSALPSSSESSAFIPNRADSTGGCRSPSTDMDLTDSCLPHPPQRASETFSTANS